MQGAATHASRWRLLTPLVLGTMASQSLLVVLAPTIVAISRDLDTTVATVGQARSITAAVSITVSVAIIARGEALTVSRLLMVGSILTPLACAAVAASGMTAAFLAAHVLVGLAFALLLSAGFTGIAAFPPEDRAWATGYVASANALAWIVVNPVAANLTDDVSWRAAQAVPAVIALGALVTVRYVDDLPRTGVRLRLWEPLAVPGARRWMGAEMVGFAAWTALLTFAGAFVIERTGASASTTGWILAAAAAAYVVAATRSGWLTRRVPRKRLVIVASLAMAALLPIMLGLTHSTAIATVVFCLIGMTAGVRTPASAGMGLDQLPGHPAAMMAARTATTQLGYLIGALLGGALIAGPGYGALGGVLAVGMVLSAWLVHRVDDPTRKLLPK
jgi:predicted MFS family arabinose efflux permease